MTIDYSTPKLASVLCLGHIEKTPGLPRYTARPIFRRVRNSSTLAVTLLVLGAPLISSGEDLKDVNLKCMLRGYCFAANPTNASTTREVAATPNVPRPLGQTNYGAEGRLSLVLLAQQEVPFAKAYHGFRLLLVNRTTTATNFPSCDNRLDIIQEAMQPDGHWRPVEYLPSSWCGNSYSHLTLPAGYYWEFAAPRYTGKLRVPLRFVLNIKGDEPIYSEIFVGWINQEQFTQKEGHNPANLMDPYDQ
ncbi:MAG TPA: hypothetical protein VLT36_14055 [Candidatus Dormibacteraeota bacterium]|nr:hypothetical protein [Candidatus Dormibacteraeota bacterium]